MKNIFVIFGLVFIFAAALSLTGCGDGGDAGKAAVGTQPQERTEVRGRGEAGNMPPLPTMRLNYMASNGLPQRYKAVSMPTEIADADGVKGRELYKKNCAACHGAKGDGDSVMGRALKPQASNLLMVSSGIPEATDGYFFWTLTEGGRAMSSAMPSFATLSEEDRWRIINALRKGLK